MNAKEYYQKNRKKILARTRKIRQRKCRGCGKICWGKYCMACTKKGTRSSLSQRRGSKRYADRNPR
jgi:hypothetical protein